MPKALAGALADVRIIDLGHVLAAPTAAMILADMGAEVIHLEPPRGDDAREFGPFINGQSGYFISINRNKKSMVIDLKKSEGKEILRDLIKVSDVVLENFRPTTMAKLGFSYKDIKIFKPDIIYAAITGFGHDALPEYATKPAYDMVAQAFSGLMSITGPENGAPVRVGSSVGDIVAGHQCAIGILSALWYRERTGQGQKIDISMVDGLVYALENAIVRYTVSGEVPQPLGTKHPAITPFQALRTQDNWIVVAIGNDALWQKFCTALAQPKLAEDTRFTTNDLRTQNRTTLVEILEEVTTKKNTSEWMAILEESNLPYSPVNTIDQMVEDPIINYRNMVVEVDQPGVGPMKIVGSPFHLSETPGEVTNPAPLLGQHTTEVLTQVLNYSEEKIQQLIDEKVAITNN
jgi:CoA:oxalate CoA-transferase